MKVICIGDPHIKSDNIPEVNLFIEKLCELIKNEDPDIIIVLGDLLHHHERVHSISMNKAYEFIRRIRELAPVYILVGNHDMYNNRQFLTENHWMNGLKEWENVTIVDQVVHRDIEGCHLLFVPYVPPGRFEEALNTHEREWKDVDCIFAHQEFSGCKMGAIVSVEGDKWPEDFPEVVSGHIHSRQKPQENLYYTGSAMQHAFGESEKNIIAVLSWNNKGEKYDLKEVDLELPRKRIVYKDIADMDEYTPKESSDKVKITVSGNQEEFKAFKKTKKYEELIKSGKRVVFKPKKIQAEDDMTPVNETDFEHILSCLVMRERNPYLVQAHDLVVNNKDVNVKDIFFPKIKNS